MSHQSLGNRLGGDVAHRNGFRPARESVNESHKVGVSLGGWQRSNNVQVDMVESLRCHWKTLYWAAVVAVHFGCLALNTGSGPLSNVLQHAGPHKALLEELAGGLNTRVC